MDEREKQLLQALVCMVEQYLEVRDDDLLDSHAMTAGEKAIEALAVYGFMEVVREGRVFGRWTATGTAFSNSF
jgi:hypothetical protein